MKFAPTSAVDVGASHYTKQAVSAQHHSLTHARRLNLLSCAAATADRPAARPVVDSSPRSHCFRFSQIVGAQIPLRVGDRRLIRAADRLRFDQHRQRFEVQPFPTAALLQRLGFKLGTAVQRKAAETLPAIRSTPCCKTAAGGMESKRRSAVHKRWCPSRRTRGLTPPDHPASARFQEMTGHGADASADD